MTSLPDDVTTALVRGIGAYIREMPPQELPAPLRRFRSFRPQALNAHRSTLLAVLDDDALRARIGHWLDNDKPPLSKEDARLLRVATAREDDWEDELQGAAKTRPVEPRTPARSDDSKLETERSKARKAKEDAKRARDELKSLSQRSSARIADLEAQVADLRKRLEAAERQATAATKEADRATDRAERAERKVKSATEKLQSERDDARKEARELKKELAALSSAAEPPKRTVAKPSKTRSEPMKRTPLRVPKGRLADDPKTLEGWLARDDVSLVIDGYNVAKADGGYEDLQLESQRERLVDAVFTLAKMTATNTLIVFDAQRVPGRRAKKTRRPVTIEWSHPGEIADDYIIERIEKLAKHPVVLVTNDRELQERGREHHATIATSQQLLRLLR